MTREESFSDFMERALHGRAGGYYSRQIAGIGRGGDFTTAPVLSLAPARAIAKWVVMSMKSTACRHLIEVGPGDGSLAMEVRRALPIPLRWRLKFHLVETSAPLEQIQRKRLGKAATWHEHLGEALQHCRGEALIYSNELVDAFPVRRFQQTDQGWQEVFLRWYGSQPLPEEFTRKTPLPDSSIFGIHCPVGQRVEVHESYRDYLQQALPYWKRGRLLTIDYGSEAETLYWRKPMGSVRAYAHQQRFEGAEIYRYPGRRDLTADVNFTDLRDWPAPWVSESNLMTFQDFVGKTWSQSHPVDQMLSDLAGAGGAFLVLDQACRLS